MKNSLSTFVYRKSIPIPCIGHTAMNSPTSYILHKTCACTQYTISFNPIIPTSLSLSVYNTAVDRAHRHTLLPVSFLLQTLQTEHVVHDRISSSEPSLTSTQLLNLLFITLANIFENC